MDTHFNGLGMHLGNLARLSNARSRSISAENPTGAKGRGGMATEGSGAVFARELGRGWKISPSISLAGNLVDLDFAQLMGQIFNVNIPQVGSIPLPGQMVAELTMMGQTFDLIDYNGPDPSLATITLNVTGSFDGSGASLQLDTNNGILQLTGLTTLAYVICLVVYQVGMLFG